MKVTLNQCEILAKHFLSYIFLIHHLLLVKIYMNPIKFVQDLHNLKELVFILTK